MKIRFSLFYFLLPLIGITQQFGNKMDMTQFVPQKPIITWAPFNNPVGVRDKPIVDSYAIKHWISLECGNVEISNDGEYVMYNILNQPYQNNTLIVKSINGKWEKQLIGIEGGFFTTNNREFIYKRSNTISIIKLGTDEEKSIDRVKSFQFPKSVNGKWLLYQLQDTKDLFVVDLQTGDQHSYSNVINYQFDEDNGLLLVSRQSLSSNVSIASLELIKLSDQTGFTVWSGTKIASLIKYRLDASRGQCVFMLADSTLNSKFFNYSLWYYKPGLSKALKILDNESSKLNDQVNLEKTSSISFSNNGRYIITKLRKPALTPPNSDAINIDVWSYKDSLLQSIQLLNKRLGNVSRDYRVAMDLESASKKSTQSWIRLDNDGEELNTLGIFDDFFVVDQGGIDNDRFWEREYLSSLVSLKSGSRKVLFKSSSRARHFWASPGEKYLVVFKDDKQYYSYDLKTGAEHCLSSKIPTNFGIPSPYHKGNKATIWPGLAGWMGTDEFMLVYDSYDIWQIDLRGSLPAKNLTQGFGRNHGLKIRLVNEKCVLSPGDTVVISLFDPVSKYNGLYNLILDGEQKISSPYMIPATFYYNTSLIHAATSVYNETKGLRPPVKARSSNTWIVLKQGATESPNYFITHDFKEYKPLTNLEPQKNYNWLTAELLQWKKPDNSYGHGVLYKPENFDPKKKYPVIIYYYEWMSGRVHQFPIPDFICSTHANVAWFVSHGYLVFLPDMVYEKNKVMESVGETVVSAGQSLAMLPYVDGKKMGITGFSWGGLQTNWLIANTNIFAAAATGGASADPISTALQVWGSNGEKTNNGFEGAEGSFGGTLWERPNVWFKNSPVLRADKVTMPVLMMNNYQDLLWQQGAELYIALRRLNKKIWMLQYDDGSHGVTPGKDGEDFTIRITQFFDHYLKDAPPPRWMTKGIPANLKGIENGYVLDPAGNCGKDCKVCTFWNEKVKDNSVAVMKEEKKMEEK